MRKIAVLLGGSLLVAGACTAPATSERMYTESEVDRIVVSVRMDERARFSDALRLLQNLGAAVEAEYGYEHGPKVEEAIEQAKERIKEWLSDG